MPELMKVMEDWSGYQSLHETKRPEDWDKRLAETINLLSNKLGLPRHKHEFLMREALTTSDFPYLFGDVLDRQLLASYKATDPVWKAFTKMSTVRDFRVNRRFAISGGDQHLEQVPEKGEYPASDRDEARYNLQVYKYGRQFDISWEALINDDLNALKDTPERFAKAAARTEHRIITGLYCNDVGTHAAGNLFDHTTAGALNCVVTALSIISLEAGVQFMQGLTDVGGEPIYNRPKFLVVPPGLEFTARQILTSANKMWLAESIDIDGTIGSVPYPTNNVIAQWGLQLIVDPYLPIFDATNGQRGWYLFSDPGDIAALEFAHLAGHENPEICMKMSDKATVGGGAISPFSGDFATDNVFYRVRVVAGACKLDWRACYMGGHV